MAKDKTFYTQDNDAKEVLKNAQRPEVKAAIAEYHAKAKKTNDEIVMRFSRTETAKYDAGQVDFALFSLIMTRVDFTQCDDWNEVLMKFYTVNWPYMAKLINENLLMKTFIIEHAMDRVMELDEGELKESIMRLIRSETDPIHSAKGPLEEMKKAAMVRSKLVKKHGLKLV